MKWSPSQTTWRTNVKQIIYHSSDYIWDDFPTLAIFRCFCPFRIRPMYFYLSDVIMSMVSSDLHHQVKVSWGKRLGNSDKTPLEPMEALISIEGQKQKVWSCYIKLRLNCVYPLLLSLNPVWGGVGRKGGREGRREGREERKIKRTLLLNCSPTISGNTIWWANSAAGHSSSLPTSSHQEQPQREDQEEGEWASFYV